MLLLVGILANSSVRASCTAPHAKSYMSADYIIEAEHIGAAYTFQNLMAQFRGTRSSLDTYEYRIRILEVYKGDIQKGDVIKIWAGSEHVIKSKPLFLSRSSNSGKLIENGCLTAHYPMTNGYASSLNTNHVQEYARAIKTANNKIQRNPSNTLLRLEKAETLSAFLDYWEASKEYSHVLGLLDPDWGNWTEGKLKNLDQAKYHIAKTALSGLSHSLYETGNVEKAYKVGRLQKTLNPSLRALRAYHLAAIELGKAETLNNEKLQLTSAFLKDANLSSMTIPNSDFTELNGLKIDFTNSDLTGSDFTNSNFRQTNFDNAILVNTKFSREKLLGNPKFQASFKGTDLQNAELRNIRFHNTTFENANLSYADLSGSMIGKLSGAKLTATKLKNITCWAGDFSNLDMSKADLSGSKFNGCNFENTNLSNSRVENVGFGWEQTKPSNFKGANLKGTDLENTGLVYALYDCRTQFPEGFDPIERFMIPVWDNCEGEAPKPDFSEVEKEYSRLVKLGIHMGGTFGNIQGQNLRRANLGNLKTMRGITFANSDLSGADLSQMQIPNNNIGLQNSIYDENTKWPPGFNPEER